MWQERKTHGGCSDKWDQALGDKDWFMLMDMHRNTCPKATRAPTVAHTLPRMQSEGTGTSSSKRGPLKRNMIIYNASDIPFVHTHTYTKKDHHGQRVLLSHCPTAALANHRASSRPQQHVWAARPNSSSTEGPRPLGSSRAQ